MADLLAPQFQDHDVAREYLERKRWPNGPVCPHCGVIDEATKLEPRPTAKGHARKGLWRCRACEKQFSVTVGTIFEDSHIPLHKWLLAYHLLCSSKKGMSAHQLHRMLGVTYKTAWFLAHRIRYTMTQEPLSSKLTGIVEVDEAYIGGKLRTGPHANKPGERPKDRPSPTDNKKAVVSLLQRGGKVRSIHVAKVTAKNLKPIVQEMIDKSAHLMTDTSTVLESAGRDWKHDRVNHSAGEYVRYEDGVCITTNTVEGFFGILKRGIDGVYHHVSEHHLHRYLTEFDFRYNARAAQGVSDGQRTLQALKGADGKRLMYRDSCAKVN